MDHPIIRKMERDGFLEPDEPVFYDDFGTPIHEGDEYYEFDDHRFLRDGLSGDAIGVLVRIGAIKKVCARDTDQ